MMKNNIVLGTMNFGIQNTLSESMDIVTVFLERGYNQLDTAYVYNNGESERIVGEILSKIPSRIKVATKVNPKVTGLLDSAAIFDQLNTSLERLKLDCIDLLYLHFPDEHVPLEDSLSAINQLYNQGKIKHFGLSNYSAEMVEEVCKISILNDWIMPYVYEGMYNVLARKVENGLFDVLRKYNIKFYAYNPLAGGLLSGRYTDFDTKPNEGRFHVRPNYLNRYWKKSFFNAINKIIKELKNYNMTLAEASLKWLAYHSKLDFSNGDAIIVGVSKKFHLENNIDSIENNNLDSKIVRLFNKLWFLVKDDSPNYFRFYNQKI